ncbi:MAG TPA: hypothetical protein VJ850_08985 [Candidatus Limnocylindrales bacterium]|nr:hypothetical protein [Candidatus Limnocylindrales bacterium]
MSKPGKKTPFGPGRSSRPAIVAWMPVDYGFYAQSYRYVGEGMIDKAHEEQLEDFYVYAIGYIYRHALELALKHVNYVVERSLAARANVGLLDPADRLTQAQVDEQMADLPSHRLLPLLNRLEKRYQLIKGAEPLDPEVRAVIEAVGQFDPDGQKFRFPYLRKGAPSFTPPKKGQSFVDLEGIRDTIDPVIGYLIDGMDGWLSGDIDGLEAMREDVGM